MGSGPARPDVNSDVEERELTPEVSARLGAALRKLDAVDPEFKTNRDDTRYSQNVKAWGRLCRDIDTHLRGVGNAFHEAQQLSLDIGVDGQGANAKPWLEEMGRKLPKLYFRLHEGKVQSYSNNKLIAQGELTEITYEWIEACAVEWIIQTVEQKVSPVKA